MPQRYEKLFVVETTSPNVFLQSHNLLRHAARSSLDSDEINASVEVADGVAVGIKVDIQDGFAAHAVDRQFCHALADNIEGLVRWVRVDGGRNHAFFNAEVCLQLRQLRRNVHHS